MIDRKRATIIIPLGIVILFLSFTTPNFSDLPSFEVKKPLDRANEIFKIQKIRQEYLKIEQTQKTLDSFDNFAVYRMTFMGKDLIYSNYHFWVFNCYLALGLLSIVLLDYSTEDWRWKISHSLRKKKLFKNQKK